jgi:hypothetical protein
MRSHELTVGHSFGLSFDHGEDLFAALSTFCREHGVRQGYIPFFVAGLLADSAPASCAGFSTLRVVGTCAQVTHPVAPVRSGVYLTNVEAHGGGTVAYDPSGT